MKDSIFRISLDILEHGLQAVLKAKKTDTGRKLCITLREGSIPYIIADDCYAVFKATKPDGTVLYNSCTIENNEIIYEFTKQTCSVSGKIRCEISLYATGDKLITSPCFALLVDDTVYPDETVESADEFSALANLVVSAQEVIDEAAEVTLKAFSAAEAAKAETQKAAVAAKNADDAAAVANASAVRAEAAADAFETDPLLSTEGKAADAKVTGDRLKALEEPEAPLSIEKGGTGAKTAEEALQNLGVTVPAEKLNFLAGAKENVQKQLDRKTPVGLVTRHIEVTDDNSLETQINAIYEEMANVTSELVEMRKTGDAHLSIGGGSNWQFLISKTNANYGSIIAWRYPDSAGKHVLIRTRGLYNGTWGNWVSPIMDGNWTLLWKNASPTSKFGPQIVNIPSGDRYKNLIVQFRYSTSYGRTQFVSLTAFKPTAENDYIDMQTGQLGQCYFPVGYTGTTFRKEVSRYVNRPDLVRVSFQSAVYNRVQAENSAYAIPVAIYGQTY